MDRRLAEPSTREIVEEFIKAHLRQNGHPDWQPHQPDTRRKDDLLNKICQSLIKISNELQEFIDRTYRDRFSEAIDIIDPESPDFTALEIIAGELFSEGITWIHILTFLNYGAELARRAMDNEGEQHVSQIIDWMCNYIDKNLSRWIAKQDGGWLSINTDGAKNKSVKSFGNFGIAALAVFVGIYLCSKFPSFQ